jgi:hypothetical protein
VARALKNSVSEFKMA